MAGGSAGSGLVNQLDTLFRLGVVGDLSDGQLVRRYLDAQDGGDQAAFTALVQRHGPMVFGVCREVLGNPHDAQDAFQATFLVLARKAGSVRKADSLASWLHGVALRVARRARTGAARRRAHERRGAALRVAERDRQGGSHESWSELHEEIARLPERYREPVVLYYLVGLSTEETAMRIGCPAGTILSRLSRARERLRGQLDRRGIALSAALLPKGAAYRAASAMPAGLLDATVRAVLLLPGGPPSGAAVAATLAREVLPAMAVSRMKILAATALACGIAWGGVQTYVQLGGRNGSQKPDGSAPDADERHAALNRSLDRLQSELDETTRRTDEMRRAVQDIRVDLKALHASRPPSVASAAATRFAEAIDAESAQAVGRLADAMKRHPARLSRDRGYGYQLYMLDLVDGGTTLIVDEPMPDQVASGMPQWSHDGRRIVFETTGSQWPLARMMAIEARDGRPTFTDLGPGNHPTFSPDDGRIAFGLRPDAEPGAESGIWVMQADGSGRRRVGVFGAPFWSPDGREFLINSYSLPTESIVIDLKAREAGVVEVAGHSVFSWPSWAGPGTLVSALATAGEPDTIALIDVRRPATAKIIEVLWKRGDDLDVTPRWPVYRPDTRRCYFVGEEATRRALYMVQRGESRRARRMEVAERQRPGQHQQLGGLSFSPDGRYLLFSAQRPEPSAP